MSSTNNINEVNDARKHASEYIEHGINYLAHAFNACNDNSIGYRYNNEVQDRFKDIALELIDISLHGDIELQPMSNTEQCVEYKQLPWGDLIYGTKSQLQSLGLGVGLLFPDEKGFVKGKTLTTEDPRGFKARITLDAWKGEGIYCASISFPNRERKHTHDTWLPYVVGVSVRHETCGDTYRGSGEALINAGLVDLATLPGMPNMLKTTVTINPDSTIAPRATNNRNKAKWLHGTKIIRKYSIKTYEVTICVSDEESAARVQQYLAEEKSWEIRMNALPRPTKLTSENVKSFIQENITKQSKSAKNDKKFQGFLSNITNR